MTMSYYFFNGKNWETRNDCVVSKYLSWLVVLSKDCTVPALLDGEWICIGQVVKLQNISGSKVFSS